jgi:uncharacterized protein (TIGR02145 family)
MNKKRTPFYFFFSASCLILIMLWSCKKEEPIVLPAITTMAITEHTASTARTGGIISSDGGSTVTKRGVVWSTNENPTLETNLGTISNGTGTGSWECELTNLTPNTIYYIRAFATNSAGTVYGNQESFSTENGIITLTTTQANNITAATTVSGGDISSDGGSAITKRGVVWSTNENPTVETNQGITSDGTGKGSFSSNLTGLTLGFRYYIRAYATNNYGTNYGNQMILMYDGPGATITDADGNIYNTVWINGKLWMNENLKTTKFNDGSDIPFVSGGTGWLTLITPAYCWYDNDKIANGILYGTLYNWYAVSTGKLCPTGWRVPSDAEWENLVNYAGGYLVAGTKLKGKTGWNNSGGGTDIYGFSALPGGMMYSGSFINKGSGYWWSATDDLETTAWYRTMVPEETAVYRGPNYKTTGLNIRCTRDR